MNYVNFPTIYTSQLLQSSSPLYSAKLICKKLIKMKKLQVQYIKSAALLSIQETNLAQNFSLNNYNTNLQP